MHFDCDAIWIELMVPIVHAYNFSKAINVEGVVPL